MKPNNLPPAELLRRYLAAIPGMTEGEGRDRHVFATACKVIERFDLADEALETGSHHIYFSGNNFPPIEAGSFQRRYHEARIQLIDQLLGDAA